MTIDELVEAAVTHAKAKGFSTDLVNNPDKVCKALLLIHEEVAEAGMAFAKHGTLAYYTKDAQGLDKPEGLAIELADVLLRIANLCGALSLDLEEAVKEKHIYNLTRPWRHSKPGPEGPG